MKLLPHSSPAKNGASHTRRLNTYKVWQFLLQASLQEGGGYPVFPMSREQILVGTSIGSLGTVDNALFRLEAYGLMERSKVPPFWYDAGYVYHLLTLDENPTITVDTHRVAKKLREIADNLYWNGHKLDDDQKARWSLYLHEAYSKLTHPKGLVAK